VRGGVLVAISDADIDGQEAAAPEATAETSADWDAGAGVAGERPASLASRVWRMDEAS